VGAAEREEVSYPRCREDGRSYDAEQRIAALNARSKDGDTKNGPHH